ncbi:MAG: PIN domain nuclease [Nitrospirae bacterium]|nr:PIN domain nuclease [Candidatus Troglogloeales bacterium]
MILVDTSVWIHFFRATPSLFRTKLHQLIEQENDLCLTAIHLTEILQGIKSESEFERTLHDLLAFPILLLGNRTTHIHAARIYRDCRQQGKTVRNTVDCLIAAVAIENDFTLFHNDKDFDAIAACTRLKLFVGG